MNKQTGDGLKKVKQVYTKHGGDVALWQSN